MKSMEVSCGMQMAVIFILSIQQHAIERNFGVGHRFMKLK